MLSLPQPWASLLSRGAIRFAVCEEPTTYRGTIALHASDEIDPEVLERLESDAEFIERLTALGLASTADVEALPREAIVGVAAVADVWSLDALEEVATEEDAILLGDVAETYVFWELAEPVEITVIPQPAAPFDEMSETQAAAVAAAAMDAGARFDADGLVFWPLTPSESLATLIGEDAIGDREITRRVWAYVMEQDLQDPEDNAYVYLDDALRAALGSDADGMTSIEFGECIHAQLRK